MNVFVFVLVSSSQPAAGSKKMASRIILKAPDQESMRVSVEIHKFTLKPCEWDRAVDIPLVAAMGGGQLDALKCHSIIQPDTDED